MSVFGATPVDSIPVKDIVQHASEVFVKQFNVPPTHAACSPGRVNLIGEHVDYCDGFVLPMAIQLSTVVVGRPMKGDKCEVYSDASGLDERSCSFSSNELKPGEPSWANYVKGVVANFKPDFSGGLQAVICSTVPLGSGLSSSAALEVAFYTFLESLTNTYSSIKDKALACQQAEHKFAGAPCGVMDQFITTAAKANNALLLDCRSLETRLVPFPASFDSEAVFLVTNSNVKHSIAAGQYPVRRRQCEQVLERLGRSSFRELQLAQLRAEASKLNNEDGVLVRRATHVIGEIDRTQTAADALGRGDLTEFGRLMNESHNSLRDLFEVSCDEIDQLVELARSSRGVYGSRMTGGGFGGCTVTLVRRDCVDALRDTIKAGYKGTPTFYVCSPADGARVLSVS